MKRKYTFALALGFFTSIIVEARDDSAVPENAVRAAQDALDRHRATPASVRTMEGLSAALGLPGATWFDPPRFIEDAAVK